MEPDPTPARLSLPLMMVLFIGYCLARPMMRLFYRIRIERDPRWDGASACVLAANHRSFMDPPLVSVAARRPISYFARANLWKIPVVRQFLQVLEGIPVDRNAPALRNMRQVVDHLKRGKRILVFPEGTRTRSGRVGRMREGPALFARRAGVPVVPVYLFRSETAWPRGWPVFSIAGHVRVRVGAPIVPPAGVTGKDADRLITVYLQRWMERRERELMGPA